MPLSRRWGNVHSGQRSGRTAQRVRRGRRFRIAMLTIVRKGRMWRVQITAANGYVRLFGRFYSEKSAREWIAAHACLTVPHTIN